MRGLITRAPPGVKVRASRPCPRWPKPRSDPCRYQAKLPAVVGPKRLGHEADDVLVLDDFAKARDLRVLREGEEERAVGQGRKGVDAAVAETDVGAVEELGPAAGGQVEEEDILVGKAHAADLAGLGVAEQEAPGCGLRQLEGAAVAARSLRPRDAALVGGDRAGAGGDQVDGRAAAQQRIGGGRAAVVVPFAEERVGGRQVAGAPSVQLPSSTTL